MEQRNRKWYRRLGVGALALVIWPGGTASGETRPDFWQTAMSAAAEAQEAADFETEAILLRAAFADAQAHDSHGPRQILTWLPLLLAYKELEKENLWRPLEQRKPDNKFGTVDKGVADYVVTLRKFADSYDDGRQSPRDNEKESSFKRKRDDRAYGAEQSYEWEILLRDDLMPEDELGLAVAQARRASVVASRGRDSIDLFTAAVRHYRHAQDKQNAAVATDRRFTVSESGSSVESYEAGSTNLVMISLLAAEYSLKDADRILEKAKLSSEHKLPDEFYAKLDLAATFLTQQHRAVFKPSWPNQPAVGWIHWHFGWLHRTEYRSTKIDPTRFSNSLEEAKSAYETALEIFEHSSGHSSSETGTIANEYRELLRDAGKCNEAADVQMRYGLATSGSCPD